MWIYKAHSHNVSKQAESEAPADVQSTELLNTNIFSLQATAENVRSKDDSDKDRVRLATAYPIMHTAATPKAWLITNGNMTCRWHCMSRQLWTWNAVATMSQCLVHGAAHILGMVEPCHASNGTQALRA